MTTGVTVELARAPYVLARALAATVLVMAGALLAHTWAGGHVPGLPALLLLAGVVLGAGVLALRGDMRLRLLLPVVALAQTGLHGMFGLLGDTAHQPADHPGHAMSGPDPASWSWQMLAAHAVGTLLTALAWWVCDRAVVAVVTVLAFRTAYAGGRRDPRPHARTVVRPSLVPLVVAPRRGPPVLA